MIDKKSKIVFISIAMLTIVSVLATYYKFVVLNDFKIIDDTEDVSNEMN